MKCSACGKEFDEGFAYCPWCGNNATTRDDVAALRRIAAEEKLRDLRRDEIGWGVVGALGLIGKSTRRPRCRVHCEYRSCVCAWHCRVGPLLSKEQAAQGLREQVGEGQV